MNIIASINDRAQLQLKFDRKPSADVLRSLRTLGFQWRAKLGAWVFCGLDYSSAAQYAAGLSGVTPANLQATLDGWKAQREEISHAMGARSMEDGCGINGW